MRVAEGREEMCRLESPLGASVGPGDGLDGGEGVTQGLE